MQNISNHEVMTLDPKKFFGHAVEIKKNGHREISYRLDMLAFIKRGDYERSALISTGEINDNALVSQIEFVAGEKYNENDLLKDHLKYHLVLLDFAASGGRWSGGEEQDKNFDADNFEKNVNKGLDAKSFKELYNRIKSGRAHSEAFFFLFRNGFDIEFEKELTLHFSAFDSSNSMMRAKRVSFINNELKEEVDKRLMLGMDLGGKGIQVCKHKYFAYRGLYWTDGTRINTSEEDFVLNKETVVIIKDFSRNPEYEFGLITAKEKSGYWDINSQKGIIDISSFDGEGIISPRYAALINKQLSGAQTGATSFQIRMPFVKGMLHMVDFKEFLKNECNIDIEKGYVIKDAFGRERDITKAEIIMTESMVKFKKWLRDYLEKENPEKDPMEYYFEKIKDYYHSLYIVRTDLSLRHGDGKIKLNYQFLNTLSMDNTQFDELVGKYIEEIQAIKNDPQKQIKMVLGDNNDSGDTEPEPEDQIEMHRVNERKDTSAWKYALSMNENYAAEKYIREKIVEQIYSRIKDIYKGHIRVDGENRFLSGDLWSLLIHIYQAGDYSKEIVKELISGLINSSEFRMYNVQGKDKALKAGKEYGFLRSPHLSRNEDGILKYSGPNDKVDKYFKCLSGVIMAASNSLLPMTLGGADFDGDMVKIIKDEDIIKAMKRGKKSCREIVVIPSEKESERKAPDQMSYGDVKDTFGNRIGEISNMAISLGESVYSDGYTGGDKGEWKHTYVPADCTLLTGLEIDAAKTGKHPWENINELKDQIKNEKSAYLSKKKELDKLDSADICVKDTQRNLTEEKYTIVYQPKSVNKEEKKKKEEIEIKDPRKEDKTPNLERLPYYFCKEMFDNRKIQKFKAKIKADNDAANRPDAEKKRMEAKAIVDVYHKYSVKYRFLKLNDEKKETNNTGWYGKIMTIFQKQHYGQKDYSEKDIKLKSIYSAIADFIQGEDHADAYGETPEERAGNIVKKIEELRYIWTPEKDRAEKLYEIIPGSCFDDLQEKEECIDLLTDFTKKGYMLLYYIVKDIENKIIGDHGEAEKEKNNNVMEKTEAGETRFKDESPEYIAMYDSTAELLKRVYSVALSEGYSLHDLNMTMMGIIQEYLIKDRIVDYMDAFYSVSPAFFWEFYSGKRFRIFEESGWVKADQTKGRNNTLGKEFESMKESEEGVSYAE